MLPLRPPGVGHRVCFRRRHLCFFKCVEYIFRLRYLFSNLWWSGQLQGRADRALGRGPGSTTRAPGFQHSYCPISLVATRATAIYMSSEQICEARENNYPQVRPHRRRILGHRCVMHNSIAQKRACPASLLACGCGFCLFGRPVATSSCTRAKHVCAHVTCARMPACNYDREWRRGSYVCLCVRCELLSNCISGFPLLQNPLKPSPLTFVSVPLPVSSVMWESSERHACKTRTHKHACMRAQIQSTSRVVCPL